METDFPHFSFSKMFLPILIYFSFQVYFRIISPISRENIALSLLIDLGISGITTMLDFSILEYMSLHILLGSSLMSSNSVLQFSSHMFYTFVLDSYLSI